MKKMFLGLMLLTSSAWGSEMFVTIPVTDTYALPVPMRSCAEEGSNTFSIGPNSVEFSSMTIEWTGAKPLTVAYIQLNLESPELVGGAYSSIIVGDELAAILGKAQIPESSVMNSRCSIRSGGLKFVHDYQSAFAKGTIKVVATDGESFFENSIPVTVYYSGTPSPR